MVTGGLYEKYIDRLSERDEKASKGDYGRLLIIGGSVGMAGAAFLSGYAAFKSGIGMVRYYGPDDNRMILQTLLPEAMYETESRSCQPASAGSPVLDFPEFSRALSWADYIICGPGLSLNESARKKTRFLFESDLSEKKLVLLDADCLNIISEMKYPLKALSGKRNADGKKTNIVITPHVGEMSRLTGSHVSIIRKSPEKTALEFSAENNCVTVLKDAVSYIASPEGIIYRNNSGHAAMAKAGSGDVLTGVIAGVTAVTGADAFEGAALGDFIHGKAGEFAAEKKGVHSVLARDIAESAGCVIGYKGEYNVKSL